MVVYPFSGHRYIHQIRNPQSAIRNPQCHLIPLNST
jgi:hypothetical protein